MVFLSRIIGLIPGASQVHRGRRPAARRRSPLAMETLENRSLLSVAGVSLSYGTLAIQAPKPSSGNVAVIAIDPSNKDVQVTFNGQSEEFAPGLVANISYMGGSGGGDPFTNNTSLPTLGYTFGSGNVITGGSSYNYFYFWGNNNTYNAAAGSISDLFEIGGKDTANDPPNTTVQVYTWARIESDHLAVAVPVSRDGPRPAGVCEGTHEG